MNISQSFMKGALVAVVAAALLVATAGIALGQTTLDVASQAEIDNVGSASNYALLQVTNTVINDNGGTNDEDDFVFFIDGMEAQADTRYVLEPGFHRITEQGDHTSGREYVTAWSSNCPGGVVFLSAGQNVSCAVVNNDLALEVIPGGVGGSDFVVDNTPGLGRGGAGGAQAMLPLLISLSALVALATAVIVRKLVRT